MLTFGLIRGLILTFVLIAYFLLMHTLGLAGNVWLRASNALFMALGVYLSIRSWKRKNGGQVMYFRGLAIGMVVSTIVALMFSLFLLFYLQADAAFMAMVEEKTTFFSLDLTPLKAAVVIFIEALFSGYIFSFASMQILKVAREKDQELA